MALHYGRNAANPLQFAAAGGLFPNVDRCSPILREEDRCPSYRVPSRRYVCRYLLCLGQHRDRIWHKTACIVDQSLVQTAKIGSARAEKNVPITLTLVRIIYS